MSSSNTKQLEQIKKNIEEKTEKKVFEGYNTGKIIISSDKEKIQESSNFIENIMQQGADEFKEKTGRPMTYSEMREMYG